MRVQKAYEDKGLFYGILTYFGLDVLDLAHPCHKPFPSDKPSLLNRVVNFFDIGRKLDK